jgi:hypothetical protein
MKIVLIQHIGSDMTIADPVTKGLLSKSSIGHVESMSIIDETLLA